jgi:hypothetical protein
MYSSSVPETTRTVINVQSVQSKKETIAPNNVTKVSENINTKSDKNQGNRTASPIPTSQSQPSSASVAPVTKLVCDKCDGKHETSECPYYRKARDSHPDAQKNFYKKLGGTSNLPGALLKNARVVRQPGDGSCLFHSMSYGLADGSNANSLRREICSYIDSNPKTNIADTPIRDWVKWDSNSSVSEYVRKMSRGAWGGGIEMACTSLLKGVNIHVYERSSAGYVRISAFDHPDQPERRKTVRVLYCGGVHYGMFNLFLFLNVLSNAYIRVTF